MLTLPTVFKESLGIKPINLGSLPKRYMNDGELDVLAALVNSVEARDIIEIGCNEGRTARVLLDNVPTLQSYTGIDVPKGYHFAKNVQRNEVPTNPGHYAADDRRFRLLLSRRGSFDLTALDLPEADAIFIDGDHSRAAVEHDTTLATSLIRRGGIIIWHDYHDLGTVDVRDVLHGFGHRNIQHVADTWIAFQKF